MTIYRWVQRFTPMLVAAARPCRHAIGSRWFVDETYVKVAGKWRYVYRNSSTKHISSASPVSLDSGAETSKQFDLTGPSSSDTQVDKVEIYRTTDGGAIFFRVGETNNGGTWAFTDNVADLALGTLKAALEGENDPPPVGLIAPARIP